MSLRRWKREIKERQKLGDRKAESSLINNLRSDFSESSFGNQTNPATVTATGMVAQPA